VGDGQLWNSVKWISTWETMEGRKCFDFTSEERRLLEGTNRRRFRRGKECGKELFKLKNIGRENLILWVLLANQKGQILIFCYFTSKRAALRIFFPRRAGPQWFNLQSIKTCTGLISFIGENSKFSSRWKLEILEFEEETGWSSHSGQVAFRLREGFSRIFYVCFAPRGSSSCHLGAH